MKKLQSPGLLIFVLLAAQAAAQQPSDYQAPRTEWGQPDLQGVWNFVSETPLQRPEDFGTREFLTEEEILQARVRRAESRAEADAAEAESARTDRKTGACPNAVWSASTPARP